MEKKLPEFKPLPELGNVASNYMSAFNVGMNIYEALAYLQGYVQITYNSMDDLLNDWNNFEAFVTENINQIANEKTQEILNQWLEDGTLSELLSGLIVQIPQQNLLINADFKSGIINQRGQTEYNENNKYSIDRWIIRANAQPNLIVNNNSVTLNNDSSLIQFVYLELGKTYTFAAMINGGLKTLTFNATNSSGVIQNEWLTSYFDGSNNCYCVGVRNGNGQKEISYLKLEEGSNFTGMPVWNYASEWFNCQRYLYFVDSSSILNARYDGSNLCINFKTPISFFNKPSIIHNNAVLGVTTFNESYKNHNVSDFTVNTYNGGNINIIKPSSEPTGYGDAIVVNGFYLDAEIY